MRSLVILILVTASIEAQADPKSSEKKAQLCLLCHKPARAGVPLLEAQPEKYLVAATNAYKTKKRVDPAMQMQPNVAALSDRDIGDIARYFASRPPVVDAFPADAQRAAAGQKLVQDLKCATCHGATFSGGDLVPRLAGQSPGYLVDQFEAFAASRRTHPGGDMPSGSRADIESVAQYFASLK